MLDLFSLNPIGLLGGWARQSQDTARRNALAANSALTARRLERVEVHDTISRLLDSRAVQTCRDPAQSGHGRLPRTARTSTRAGTGPR